MGADDTTVDAARRRIDPRAVSTRKPKSKKGKAPSAPVKPRSERAGAEAPAAMDARFAAVVKALGKERGVSYGGKGFGSSALKIDDRIFAMWTSKDRFVVKLPKERVLSLVASGKGSFFDPGRGRLMKEWLDVSAPKSAWLALAKEALAFGRGE